MNKIRLASFEAVLIVSMSIGGRGIIYAGQAIEVLLKEGRSFPPPRAFKKSAHVKSAEIFAKARKDPKTFWAKAAKELDWFKPWKKVGLPLGQVVYRREAQLLTTPRLSRLSHAFRAQKQGRDHLGGRAGRPFSMSWILPDEGLDRLAMFYDVYVTRPGGYNSNYSCFYFR